MVVDSGQPGFRTACNAWLLRDVRALAHQDLWGDAGFGGILGNVPPMGPAWPRARRTIRLEDVLCPNLGQTDGVWAVQPCRGPQIWRPPSLGNVDAAQDYPREADTVEEEAQTPEGLFRAAWAASPTVWRCVTPGETSNIFHLMCTYASVLGLRVHIGPATPSRGARVRFSQTIPVRSEKTLENHPGTPHFLDFAFGGGLIRLSDFCQQHAR